MTNLTQFIVFWAGFLIFFVITFQLLIEIDLAQHYKNKRKLIAYLSYFIISLCVGTIAGQLLLTIVNISL